MDSNNSKYNTALIFETEVEFKLWLNFIKVFTNGYPLNICVNVILSAFIN